MKNGTEFMVYTQLQGKSFLLASQGFNSQDSMLLQCPREKGTVRLLSGDKGEGFLVRLKNLVSIQWKMSRMIRVLPPCFA